MVSRVRQVGTGATFVLYFTDQNSLRLKLNRIFVLVHWLTYIMPMCILYCILQIRMLIRFVAHPAFLVGRVLFGVSWRLVFGPDLFFGVMYHEALVAYVA